MAPEGGYDERDPLMDHTDDRDGDGDGDTTGPFQPGSSSTPAPNGQQRRMTTMNREDDHEEFLTETRSEAQLLDEFPQADLSKIKTSYDESGRFQVALKNPTGRQSKGTYYLYTKDRSIGEMRFNKSMPKSILIYLGESKEAQLERERSNLRQEIETNEGLENEFKRRPPKKSRSDKRIINAKTAVQDLQHRAQQIATKKKRSTIRND